jgi:hypothetical protein
MIAAAPPGAVAGSADLAPAAGTGGIGGGEAVRCAEVVERILASRPAADGTAEVRLKIDPALLPDTEIRLINSPDRGLLVDFKTDSLDSQRFLLPNLPELRNRLEGRTDGRVTVQLTENSATGGSPGDGRSRNRRTVYEEITES